MLLVHLLTGFWTIPLFAYNEQCCCILCCGFWHLNHLPLGSGTFFTVWLRETESTSFLRRQKCTRAVG